jgi:3-oxoadipate enol-lactonase
MPDIKTDDGCIIHVEVEGPQDGPVLMLSNSLGTNLHMWEDQVPAWSRHFRLIRYDRRGHGKSSVPKGRYTMERLGRDADKSLWEGRLKTVREKGLAAIVDGNMERWFTKEFRERNPQAIAKMREMFLATKPDGYTGCGEGIRDMDHRPLLAKINAPTLVIAGKQDPATPLEGNEFIRHHIAGASLAVFDTAHIANIEQPRVYADTVLKFLLN